MKSHVKQNIAKKVSESLLTMEEFDDTWSIVHLSVLGKSVVDAKLSDVLFFKKLLYNRIDNTWKAFVETMGGTLFEIDGTDLNDVIEQSNSYLKNFFKNT